MIAAVLIAAICSASAAYGRDKPGQESSCVEMLLRPPKPAKNFFISHPGRYANSQGKEGQDILMTLKYGAVEGCDNLERLPFLRLQEKRSGSSWFFPHKRFWIPFPLGHGKSNDPGEFALSDSPRPNTLATCENGARPRFRVQVRARVRILATRKVLATSPTTEYLIPYKPARAAHC